MVSQIKAIMVKLNIRATTGIIDLWIDIMVPANIQVSTQCRIAGIHQDRLSGSGFRIGCQVNGRIRDILWAYLIPKPGGLLQPGQNFRRPVDKAGVDKSRSNGIHPNFRCQGPGQGFGHAGQS